MLKHKQLFEKIQNLRRNKSSVDLQSGHQKHQRQIKKLVSQNAKTTQGKTRSSQTWKTLINTKVNNERLGSAFKLHSAKLDRDSSKINLPERINKQCNVQGSTKSLNKSCSVESMDIGTDHIITNVNLEDTWIIK